MGNVLKKKPNDVLEVKLMQDNGEKLKQNANQLESRQKKLEEEGAFRPMLAKPNFKRGFKPFFPLKITL